MNNDVRQQLSDLMDSELEAVDQEAVFASLENDTDAQGYWQRMHLARDVMRREYTPGLLDTDFASRVSAAIDDEPVPQADARVVHGAFGESKPARQTRWMRPLAGFAVAATVAAVSVLGLRSLQPIEPVGTQVAATAEAPLVIEGSGRQTPVLPLGEAIRPVNNTGTYWTLNDQRVTNTELESRLNSFLSDHIEFATVRNVGGMLPYSRLAGYDEVRR